MTLFYRVCRLACIAIGRTFCRLKTRGLENVPLSGGVILASNHQCYLDPPLATCMIRRQCNYLARSTLFAFGPFRWLIVKLGAVPLGRGESDAGGLRRAVEMLQAGHLLMLFPEGTRTRDGYLGPVLPGVAAIAARAGVPLVPTYIHGAFDLWPRGRKLPRPRRVAVLYGAPLRAEAGGGAGHKEQVRDLTSRLQAALEELQRQAFDWMPLKGRSAPDARRGAGNDGPAPASSPAPAAEGTRQAAASGAEGH